MEAKSSERPPPTVRTLNGPVLGLAGLSIDEDHTRRHHAGTAQVRDVEALDAARGAWKLQVLLQLTHGVRDAPFALPHTLLPKLLQEQLRIGRDHPDQRSLVATLGLMQQHALALLLPQEPGDRIGIGQPVSKKTSSGKNVASE